MNNPIVEGWYADPESVVYGDKVYIYVTKSLPYEEQQNIDLIVSSDLEKFDIIHDVLDMSTFPETKRCVWAPSAIEKDGKYYVIFSTNAISNDDEVGGLYVGVSENPEGPFCNVRKDGKAIIDKFHNGAQPIDAHFYKENNEVYVYYGGWDHLNVCKMNDNMDGLAPVEENAEELIREITPEGYHEGPCLMKAKNKYILMYSYGGWVNGTYCVKTATSESPLGPFEYQGVILRSSDLANGPGHNGVFQFRGRDYIAYHRRRIGDDYPHHRELCIDEMFIDGNTIKPIKMT